MEINRVILTRGVLSRAVNCLVQATGFALALLLYGNWFSLKLCGKVL